MTYRAQVLEFLIASPSDVAEERDIVRQVIAAWNATYARERHVVLMPVGWETHSSPELSGRPQQLINDRILLHADVLVGIFWTRVGSSTGKFISGSVEEIEEHFNQKKPVMLYFSNARISMEDVDYEQYTKLKKLKEWARERGLVESFADRNEFKEKFQRHLPLVIRDNNYVSNILAENQVKNSEYSVNRPSDLVPTSVLSADALELLAAAAMDPHGLILIERSIASTSIQSNGLVFGDGGSRRSIARWEAAISQLTEYGMIVDHDGRKTMFEITDLGYRIIEQSA